MSEADHCSALSFFAKVHVCANVICHSAAESTCTVHQSTYTSIYGVLVWRHVIVIVTCQTVLDSLGFMRITAC